MKRAELHETIRRGIARHMARRRGFNGAALVFYTEEGAKTKSAAEMADEIVDVIEAEHPGAITP